MTRPPRDFTQKLHFCKGCHNEIHPDMPRCIVCGTPNVEADGSPVPDQHAGRTPAPRSHGRPIPSKK